MTAEVWKAMARINKHVKAVIQLRRGNETEWIEADPILHLGEPAVSTDINKMKIGDGVHHWSELEYLSSDAAADYEALFNLPSINSITLKGDKTGSDLGLQEEMDSLAEADIDRIIFGGI